MPNNMLIASLKARADEVIQYIKDKNDISVDKTTLDVQSWVNFHEDNIRLLMQELDEIKKEIHSWNATLMSQINDDINNY